jgi:WD40 repeat protein
MTETPDSNLSFESCETADGSVELICRHTPVVTSEQKVEKRLQMYDREEKKEEFLSDLTGHTGISSTSGQRKNLPFASSGGVVQSSLSSRRIGAMSPSASSISSRIDALSTDQILEDARRALDRNRPNKYQRNEERARRIVEEARKSSQRREAQLRSTSEVLRMAGEKKFPISSLTTSSSSSPEINSVSSPPSYGREETGSRVDQGRILRCMSPTDSSVGSSDNYERAVQVLSSKFSDARLSREKMLNILDGVGPELSVKEASTNDDDETVENVVIVPEISSERQGENDAVREFEQKRDSKGQADAEVRSGSTFSYYLDLFLGGSSTTPKEKSKSSGEKKEGARSAGETQRKSLRVFSPLACGAIETAKDVVQENIRDSILRSTPPFAQEIRQIAPPFAEHVNARVVDSRMPKWISELKSGQPQIDDLSDYCYTLGKSRTVIVHEIVRGNWTWCTAWSPDGNRLAIATENHHLAIVDTSSSTVWRVQHDRRITNPIKNNTTHSIRSIAWGAQFIAIGGTGDAVSIISPTIPYPIVHVIKGTGFVGSLDWRQNSSILAIGSREDKCSVYGIKTAEDDIGGNIGVIQRVVSQELYTITRHDWVNAVAFSPGGSVLAVGDRSGKVPIFSFQARFSQPPLLEKIMSFKFDAPILDLEWSPDGLWLYAGGEDFTVTVIETSNWQVKHKIPTERWMQFVSSSNRGTHVAIGGGSSEVTILDALNDWKLALSVELKGLVPLSAKWHPKDQYLAVTGQNNSILAIETTNARHITGHYLQSISPIEQVEFSPEGQILVVGNEAGVVSFYRSDETSFFTVYEMVVTDGSSQSIVWSPNGSYVMVGSGDTLAIIGQASAVDTGRGQPARISGLGIRKVIREAKPISSISIHTTSRYVAIVGDAVSILDAANDFCYIKQWEIGRMRASAWSWDGSWFAASSADNKLVIFDTSGHSVNTWKEKFTLDCEGSGTALAWGPSVPGLQYLAYAGADMKVTILEIRTLEGAWETVLEINRKGAVNDLDWSSSGLMAVAVDDGTVTIVDLRYLKLARAVNEMNYDWQRQGITCFTEIRRNSGKNSMRTIRWMPSRGTNDCLLAIGGSDGALEVIDLTERSHCKGFANSAMQ